MYNIQQIIVIRHIKCANNDRVCEKFVLTKNQKRNHQTWPDMHFLYYIYINKKFLVYSIYVKIDG